MEAGEPSDLWVFGYGSLMWRPGFPFVESGPGRLRGYHRSLCVLSHVHRGTPERPGLVLGLDRGGSCRGMAFRVAGPDAASTLAYLREREQVTAVYVERVLGVTLDDGRRIAAVTYLVDRRHPQYAGRLPEAELGGWCARASAARAPTRTTSATLTTSSSPWASPTRCSPASPPPSRCRARDASRLGRSMPRAEGSGASAPTPVLAPPGAVARIGSTAPRCGAGWLPPHDHSPFRCGRPCGPGLLDDGPNGQAGALPR